MIPLDLTVSDEGVFWVRKKSDLESVLLDLESKNQFSGLVYIREGDAILFEDGFGYASRSWKVKNSPEIRFDTASITKLLTAVAVLQLVEKGAFSLETKIRDYLEIDLGQISGEVTLAQLLTHSSGIGDDADEEAGERYADIWLKKANYSVTETVDFLPQFIHRKAHFAPGEGCRYCNCSYVLLGLAIEKASGLAYRDYARKNIIEKAGMKDSGFFHFEQVTERVAEGADPIFNDAKEIVGWRRNIYSYPPIGSPDAGLYVTVRDLDAFLTAVHEEKLLSSEMTKAFLTPRVLYREFDQEVRKFGYGLLFALDKKDKLLFYQKEGVNAGVSAALRYYPSKDVTVVILSNMEMAAWPVLQETHKWLTKSV